MSVYIYSVEFALGEESDKIIEGFLQVFLKQEETAFFLVCPDTTLEKEYLQYKEEIADLVKELDGFVKEDGGTASGLELMYGDNHSAGYSWLITGEYACVGAEKKEMLAVVYSNSWCEEILVLVAGKRVKTIVMNPSAEYY
jgi:hypothetical protein